ncbi:hypothetical protein CLCR_06609 [Cladophialophora carrionii]|uniref:Phosphatidylcholine-sterol O-acyltransferase-like protein n=1 Tax=Cladophialophora carrionii TaxID=86049 RepID=A0A1C1CMR1_9EURO|nr:hypothetical protein CLCR_06609 [Cladophialophora carrionii]
MDLASAPGTADLTSAHGPAEDYSPVTDGRGDFVDIGTLSGNHGQALRLQTEDLYGDELIGVSLSRVQTQMRSPDTPASEKARALGLTVEYFRRMFSLAEDRDQDNDADEANNTQTGALATEEAGAPGLTVEYLRRILRMGEDADHGSDPGEANDTQPRSRLGSYRPPAIFQSSPGSSASHEAVDRRSWSRESPSSYRQERIYGKIVDHSDISFEATHPSQIQVEDSHAFQPDEYRFPPPPTRRPPSPPVRDYIPQQPRRSEIDVLHLGVGGDSYDNSHPPRRSITKSILGGVASGRRRSLSGPLANLRRLLPELPSANFDKSPSSLSFPNSKDSGQRTPTSGENTPMTRSFRFSMREPLQRWGSGEFSGSTQRGQSSVGDEFTISRSQVDGNVESLLSPSSPASNLSRARSNSESSLFIRRGVSGASAFDDISAFAHVTDLANSRFKAITDSFQNSTIKLPRLPAIRPGAKRQPSPGRASSEASREIDDVAAGPGHAPGRQHPSMKTMRNAANSIEVETPQQRAHPVLSEALAQAEGDIVILGGYRGSILRSAKPPHRQIWVPIKVGLNLRKVDLEVGLRREDEERMEQTVIPDGILSHIGPIDICRRLLKHMRKCPNARDNKLRLHNWGYDWRLSPDLLSGRLIKFLESLESNHPETPRRMRGAIVIAHSLGGLITRHAVNQRPELFAGVVFAGTPQHCVNILGPLRNGDDVLLSSRVLTAQVNFTIRTSFALLPEDGRCFIEKHTNTRFDLDFFDPQTWDEFRLSPCINPPLDHRIKGKDDRRKSIMDHLSDSITGTAKRNSWLGGGAFQGQPSQHAEARESLEGLGQRTSDKALEAEQDIEGNAEGMVGMSMKQTHQRPGVATAVTIPKDVAMDYLDRTLAEVSVFKQQLRFNPSHQASNIYPPHAIIFGKTVPTVYGVRVVNKEAIKYTDAFDDLAFAAGDGVVLASAAQLPHGYLCVKGGRVESDRGHVGIMGDLEGMGRCIRAVIDARLKGVGLGKEYARTSLEMSDVVEG